MELRCPASSEPPTLFLQQILEPCVDKHKNGILLIFISSYAYLLQLHQPNSKQTTKFDGSLCNLADYLITNASILFSHFIIIMITQISNPNPIIAQTIQQISQSREFRAHHEENMKKGIFNIVKCSFDEMVNHLITFNKNLSFENVVQISDFLKDGFKVWAYSEYKIFAWVSAWLLFKNKIELKQIIEQKSRHIQMLQLFFPQKPQAFLRYQFFLMFTKNSKLKLAWKNEQINFLAKYINKIESLPKGKNARIKWRLVSFELFIQKKCLRTPNECRERWVNHLNPKVSKLDWAIEQDIKMLTIYEEYGPKWSYIAKILKSRTEHMVKNRFNSLKHKWNSSNRQTNPYNPTAVLKRLKNKLKCINTQKALLLSANSECPSISLQQRQSQQDQQKAQEVKSQNLTLSLFDVGPCFVEENRQPQQNWTIVKQQEGQVEYCFQNFLKEDYSDCLKVECDQQQWLDNLMQKQYSNGMLQYF